MATNPPGNLAYFRIGVSALIFEEGRILLAHRRDIDWWNLSWWRNGIGGDR